MPPPHHYAEHGGRIAQMTKQEAVIANKRLELLEKKKNADLARQVAAAQVGGTVDAVPQVRYGFVLVLWYKSIRDAVPHHAYYVICVHFLLQQYADGTDRGGDTGSKAG